MVRLVLVNAGLNYLVRLFLIDLLADRRCKKVKE
jgi:hypothetical protein